MPSGPPVPKPPETIRSASFRDTVRGSAGKVRSVRSRKLVGSSSGRKTAISALRPRRGAPTPRTPGVNIAPTKVA